MTERWLVAMSGGVDSSVAAALLARDHEVVGVTMDLASPQTQERARKRCCGLEDAEDARAVARKLGIRHYTANYRDEFQRAVVEPFVAEYEAGRTPVPCVACNRVLKFDVLLRRARALGCAGVSTGHYARIAPGPDGEPSLYRPRDLDKDQTWFLFDVPRATLAKLRFPLGELSKSQVREIAASLDLPTAHKPESQGICFVPDGDVTAALARLRPGAPSEPGEIVTTDGSVLGEHPGAVGYTQGQRKGLGLHGGPWYVREVRPRENRLVVDQRSGLERKRLELGDVRWMDGSLPNESVRVQVRHRQRSVAASLALEGADVHVVLEEPVFAPAPGQPAVVYDANDERVLGGGWIAGSA